MYLLPHDSQVSGNIQQIGKRMEPFDWNKKVSVDIQLQDVDPELLKIVTGGTDWGAVSSNAGMTIYTKVKRTFWQWLCRRPAQQRAIFIPATRITFEPSE